MEWGMAGSLMFPSCFALTVRVYSHLTTTVHSHTKNQYRMSALSFSFRLGTCEETPISRVGNRNVRIDEVR